MRFLSSRKSLALALALVAALAVAATAAYLWTDTPVAGDATASGPATPPDAPAPGRQGAPGASRIAGDDVMAQAVQLFHIGYAGGLQIDEETRAALDSLVNSLPEAPSADDLARVEKAVRLSLPHEDAERALKLVHGYIGYKSEVASLLGTTQPPANADELRQLFARVDAIQQRHFTPATEQSLFGPSAREARTLLEIMVVQQDATLTEAQKQERIEALRPGATQAASAPAGGASQP